MRRSGASGEMVFNCSIDSEPERGQIFDEGKGPKGKTRQSREDCE